MRPWYGVLAGISAAALTAGAAHSATVSDRQMAALEHDFGAAAAPAPAKSKAKDAKALRAAAFAKPVSTPVHRDDVAALDFKTLNPVQPRKDDSARLSGEFAAPAYTGTGLDPARLSDSTRLVEGGLVTWNSGEVSHTTDSGAVDSVRMAVGGVAQGRGGLVLARPDNLFDPEAEAFDFSYTRGWPSALSKSVGDYDLALTPHAGLGVNNAGGSAEAGAMVSLGEGAKRKLQDMGFKDGAEFGDRGRWYLYAAASGRAVGLNMLRDINGNMNRSWSTDPTTAVISDAQAGLAWRKGSTQASFGYLHRKIKPLDGAGIPGVENKDDSLVAFSLSIKPRR